MPIDIDRNVVDAFIKQSIGHQAGELRIKRAAGGQSNPTYFLDYGSAQLVLRRRPDGQLLPSAHAVSREFRVQKALQGSRVKVPRMILHSTDVSIAGTEFYIMEYVPGRVYRSNTLGEAPQAERSELCLNAARMLGELHSVDIDAVGLGDFGYRGSYFGRQISRWGKQWQLSRSCDLDTIDHLLDWLPRNLPDNEITSLVHGDYRTGNLVYRQGCSEVAAVLDWELSTLGEPMADLAHFCSYLHLMDRKDSSEHDRLDQSALPGIGDLGEEYLKVASHAGRLGRFHLAFVLFRNAVIYEGVADRARRGNAAATDAAELGKMVPIFAQRAAEITESSNVNLPVT